MSLEELLQNNEINQYFFNQLSKSINYLPDDLQKEYINNAKLMSANGVQNHNDQKIFYYIITNAADIAIDLADRGAFNSSMFELLYSDMYKHIGKNPIDTLLNFYHAVGSSLKRLGVPLRKSLASKAYPQGWQGNLLLPPYDINRWMRATGDIYSGVKGGQDEDKIFNLITNNWDKMEKMDYKNWLRFYQEGANLKYKTAYQSEFGVYLPNPIEYSALKAKLPNPLQPQEKEDINDIRRPAELDPPKTDVNSAKDRIEGHRNRLIGRLNAAEKLLCSTDGQFFAGEDQETMLRMLQDLKRKIQTANKINVNSSLFEDLIYRAAYQLEASGKGKIAKVLYKVAQAPEMASPGEPTPPPDLLADLSGPPADLGEGTAPMESLPGESSAIPSDSGKSLSETQLAFKKFFELLEDGIPDPEEKPLEADDAMITVGEPEYGEFIVVEAQEAPEQESVQRQPVQDDDKIDRASGLEEPQAPKEDMPVGDNIDDSIEHALEGAHVSDVVRRLELVTSLFKKREIARQLSIIDILMDKLGISTFFPELAEAQRDVLANIGYVSSRIEGILTKLKGSTNIGADKLIEQELKQPSKNTSIQENLQAQQDEDKARKEKRKAVEDAKQEAALQPKPVQEALEQAPAPQVEQSQPIAPR